MRERLVQVLLELGEEYGVRESDGLQIDLPLSQQDLADLVGASRQKVNLNLRRFADQGLVRIKRSWIIMEAKGLYKLG